MNKILLIVPTRGRSKKVKEFYDCFIKESSITDLCFGIDEDDATEYPTFNKKEVFFDKNPKSNNRYGFGPILNKLALKYCYNYKYIGFAGDDNRIRTKNWDSIIYNNITNIRYAIASGQDLYRKDKLPTWVVMDAAIIRVLGFMAPPILEHLFIDNFWQDLGEGLNSYIYHDDVIMEHMHYLNKKSDIDEIYTNVNAKNKYIEAELIYDSYKKEILPQNIKLLSNS